MIELSKVVSSEAKLKHCQTKRRSVPARGANHNVGAVVLQNLLVLSNGKASKEHTNLKILIMTVATLR